MSTSTLTTQIMAVVRRNASRGVTVPQIMRALEKKGVIVPRRTVSGRVSAMYRDYRLEISTSRMNPDTGRPTSVYVPAVTTTTTYY